MRTIIVNGEAAVRAHLHQLADTTNGTQSVDVIPDGDNAMSGSAARSFWPPRVVGEKSGRFYFLDINEIEYLAAAGNYVVAHLGANEYLTRTTLKGLAAQLARLGFIQIDRSLLVNLRHVAHVERRDRGQYGFVLRSGACLVSSRERHGSIRALLLGMTILQPL